MSGRCNVHRRAIPAVALAAQLCNFASSASEGAHRDVSFTVSEGTWMSLDVSPDGKAIAFDLLNDIYLMSAEGGVATAIHSGSAVQRSPQFSADLIVLDRDPLSDIRNTNSVRYSMVNGRLYDAESMNEIGNYDRPRTRFYWELGDRHGIEWNAAWGRGEH